MLVGLLVLFIGVGACLPASTSTLKSPIITISPIPHGPTFAPDNGLKPPASAILASSVTPLPIARVTDLASDLPDSDKVFVYVQRVDQSFELFKVRSNANLSVTIPMQPGDIVFNVIPPASMMGHEPSLPKPGQSPLVLPTFVSPVSTPIIPTREATKQPTRE